MASIRRKNNLVAVDVDEEEEVSPQVPIEVDDVDALVPAKQEGRRKKKKIKEPNVGSPDYRAIDVDCSPKPNKEVKEKLELCPTVSSEPVILNVDYPPDVDESPTGKQKGKKKTKKPKAASGTLESSTSESKGDPADLEGGLPGADYRKEAKKEKKGSKSKRGQDGELLNTAEKEARTKG
eukprot:RCo006700